MIDFIFGFVPKFWIFWEGGGCIRVHSDAYTFNSSSKSFQR